MSEIIFSDFGIQIIQRDSKFYIRYDAGEIVIQMREDEITKEETIKAQKSEQDAYEVLLMCERRAAKK
jgi:hypothetical protein